MTQHNDFRLLVIDDNPAIHRDFRKILTTSSQAGSKELDTLSLNLFGVAENNLELPTFEILTASQGQEGLAIIKKSLEDKKPISLAFVDIRMPPGWDGIETIKHIWECDPDIQIVICTAYSDYSWEETIEHLGNKDNLLILKKPFDHIAVRQLACALTKKWQLLQASRQYTAHLEHEVEERTHSLEESLAVVQSTLKELKYQASHDFLTDLPNRVMLFEKMREAIKSCQKNHTQFALMFLDLDRFKLINDSLSHAVGDELLQYTAKRLKNILRDNDTLARLGGDEFVIIFNQFPNENVLIDKARHILKVLQEPFNIAGKQVSVTASIGIAIYPNDGSSVDILLRNADCAMYQAKELGSNNYQFYTKHMNEQTLEKLEKETQLRTALLKDELFLCYQPQFDLSKNNMVAVEALIRWNHPTKGVLTPMEFIPLAEETGLIIQIGEWALRTACKQNKLWQTQGLAPIRVAINVTAQQFKQQNLVELISRILKETQLEPQYLEIELTENVLLNSKEVMNTIPQLKALGVCIAIDDFGTGYSGLSYLKKIPLDRLKIDSAFIEHIQSKNDDDVIVSAIVTIANSLHLEVLAEGVETENQVNFLKKHKCGEIQGFYFSKPLTVDELTIFLKNPNHHLLVTH
jgi:diguanylate cyclase (GGDEF)-like protein